MSEAQKQVWEGAIPLQIHLHQSEVTTLPPPPPALLLAPRIGYLPLLISLLKPHFSTALPPGVDTIWFEYKGLPLKWYIPTGVLFDLLCVEPERPWNLTVHFRGYPSNLLLPCEGEDSVKWSFINSLKEAAYVINGNCKNVMNMSHPDQVELWGSVLNGNLESYQRVASKLKLGTFEDEYAENISSGSIKSPQSTGDMDAAGQVKTGRIPVRLYLWTVNEEFDDFEDAPQIDNWDKVSYINRPVEIHREDGKFFSLNEAVKRILPEFFPENSFVSEGDANINQSAGEEGESSSDPWSSCHPLELAEIKFIRIQGIEPILDIPFSWVVNNLMNPEYFLHICVCLKVSKVNAML
ncbi:autophagy protein 5 [Cajanus cajan]|uniref:Autophagy protein 5 n=1 Tax=Cajanus cajan TaxID=3821 RepID=A0A151S0U1_CAJCA|nr:autophagy protein 5 [Cajanus cajan]KYP48357.1 Autophagy protein 5 [Cajanus cajan]